MIEPIGTSLLSSGTSLLSSGTSLIFTGPSFLLGGTSFSQSGARRQPVLWRSLDPWSSADVSTLDGHFAPQPRPKITSVASIFLFEMLKLA
jgi:hypothetical protein